MKNVGKISIVLPCYKAERFVGDMIADVQAQTYKDWELIVVSNGAGQEAQLKVINSMAAQDSRIRVISVEEGGLSNARNIGMEQATGQWLAFVDADDRCDNNHLELLVSGCDDDTDMIMAGFTQVWTKFGMSQTKEIEEGHGLDEYFANRENLVLGVVWNKLFNVNKTQKWGGKFDPTIAYSEDALFCLEFCLHYKKVNTVCLCGYRYLCNDDNSVCSKYLDTLEEGNHRRRELQLKLFEHVGMAAEEIASRAKEILYVDTYMALINLFKQGSPLSFCEKFKEIKRLLFGNMELAAAMKAHDRSGDNTLIKIYNVCYATRAPFITAIVYELLFKVKYSMKGIYHLIAKYLH